MSEPPPESGRAARVMAALADGIIAVDEAGTIRICNPAAEELLGRSANELIGTPFGYPVVNGESTEIDLVLPGGRTRVVEMRATTATLVGEPLHVAALRDVTIRHEAEQEMEAELERNSMVIAVVAHEVRNPLTGIGMLVDMLREPEETFTDQERTDVLDQIADRTSRLQSLVKKLLTVAKIDAQAVRAMVEPVPVLELILERLAEFADRPNVNVTCDPHVRVLADRSELSEILINYLENAFRYGAPPFEIHVAGRDGAVEIRVCDHGPGVPEAFRPRLFERFSRESRSRRESKGSGLGLWIVRSLAQANGGEAYFEPGDQGGSCFCVRLPEAPPT
ncbi:PAS domain S-box protein [Herbidospora sp. NEAU-GS84]|uniref:Sensor-like histidine kinase SenX3 n=1 Tax=Herbidospora solisilvae TaxID=2696284 RepID=A0A7C9NPK5_9ACTN|nr:PAS domain-containing sensor histidine kinase [Herbidospora solisilvae]NAS23856.1 PAS domain S-box protein [Herbidospora solisilvae]